MRLSVRNRTYVPTAATIAVIAGLTVAVHYTSSASGSIVTPLSPPWASSSPFPLNVSGRAVLSSLRHRLNRSGNCTGSHPVACRNRSRFINRCAVRSGLDRRVFVVQDAARNICSESSRSSQDSPNCATYTQTYSLGSQNFSETNHPAVPQQSRPPRPSYTGISLIVITSVNEVA